MVEMEHDVSDVVSNGDEVPALHGARDDEAARTVASVLDIGRADR
jgi:hypothetical protein